MQAVFNPDPLEVCFDPKGDVRKPWLFVKEHTFYDGAHYMQIPAGFRCDAESTPWYTRAIIPANGNHKRAAFFHDSAYAHQNMSRFSADAGFRVIMEHDGVPKWRTVLMYWGVRLFGGLAWKGNQK